MQARGTRIFAAAAVAACLATAAAATPSAAVGPGTFTRITTPTGPSTTFKTFGPGSNQFVVSGQASADVTSVDIICIVGAPDHSLETHYMDTAVPVSGGIFSAVAVYSSLTPPPPCRLRAIPAGVDATTDYLGSFSGPILYTDSLVPITNGATQYSFQSSAEEGDGVGLLDDAGFCGIGFLTTVQTPAMQAEGLTKAECLFFLPGRSLAPAATASAIHVTGHNAYLPSAVHNDLINLLGLALPQPALTASKSVAANGDMTITESAVLMRCSVSDAYPPTHTTCPTLVSTGVRFTRVTTFMRAGHQYRVRDTYTSTDGVAHTLGLEYQNSLSAPDTGMTGFTFPGHSATFAAAHPNQVVTGLGTVAASTFIRSDIFADEGETAADTAALTWSRAPASMTFSPGSAYAFNMRYALTVPAAGTVALGFADSQRVLTTDTKSLATLAAADMMNAPTITSPANNAVLPTTSTTIKGGLTAGANGLPTSVGVNGHVAVITKTSATTGTYAVTFTEPAGKHTITTTAHDAAGNIRTASITVTNK